MATKKVGLLMFVLLVAILLCGCGREQVPEATYAPTALYTIQPVQSEVPADVVEIATPAPLPYAEVRDCDGITKIFVNIGTGAVFSEDGTQNEDRIELRRWDNETNTYERWAVYLFGNTPMSDYSDPNGNQTIATIKVTANGDPFSYLPNPTQHDAVVYNEWGQIGIYNNGEFNSSGFCHVPQMETLRWSFVYNLHELGTVEAGIPSRSNSSVKVYIGRELSEEEVALLGFQTLKLGGGNAFSESIPVGDHDWEYFNNNIDRYTGYLVIDGDLSWSNGVTVFETGLQIPNNTEIVTYSNGIWNRFVVVQNPFWSSSEGQWILNPDWDNWRIDYSVELRSSGQTESSPPYLSVRMIGVQLLPSGNVVPASTIQDLVSAAVLQIKEVCGEPDSGNFSNHLTSHGLFIYMRFIPSDYVGGVVPQSCIDFVRGQFPPEPVTPRWVFRKE